MRVEDEPKRKRTELLAEIDALALRIETITVQISAIDQVIAIYDPAYAPERSAAAKPQRGKDSRQLPPALDWINKSEAILEVLREAGQPLSTVDCTCRIAAWHGVAANDPSLPLFVTHVSAALNSLMRRSRVRQAGTVDGRKHLWEVAAQAATLPSQIRSGGLLPCQ
jgi:hypothetical protein